MNNELRKNIARNMRYAEANEQIDKELDMLSEQNTPQANMRRDFLQNQRNTNYAKMSQPMKAEEYDEYDDYGQYIGGSGEAEDDSSMWNTVTDGIGHAAQGVTLGWSDEMMGVIGGTGRVAANGILRAFGQPVNGESFSDAWKKGYEDYRDYARQELQKGYKRSPWVSSAAEIGGALASPIKIGGGIKGALGTGVIGGIGMTDTNSPDEYAINVGLNTLGSVAGEKLGRTLGNKANNFFEDRMKNIPLGFSRVNKALYPAAKGVANEIVNQINDWRKG